MNCRADRKLKKDEILLEEVEATGPRYTGVYEAKIFRSRWRSERVEIYFSTGSWFEKSLSNVYKFLLYNSVELRQS